MLDTPQNRYNVRNRALRVKQSTEYQRRQRIKVLAILGGKCVVCGIDEPRVLHVDHINGGGSTERKLFKQVRFFNQIIRGERDDVQLLCANCHTIKSWPAFHMSEIKDV